MLTLREFCAWITSEGRVLPEYLVTVDTNANKVSCWIPSEAGKEFKVHWMDTGSGAFSCGFITLDGFLVPGRFLNGCGGTWRDSVRTGLNTERPFVFAEQGHTSYEGQTNPDAGTIGLKIRRVDIEGTRSPNKLQQPPFPSGLHGTVSSHCISYGEQRETYEQSPETWNVKSYKGEANRSYVTFVFRYRPREFLLSQAIMPRDISSSIPPTIQTVPMNRRVVSTPLPAGNLVRMMPDPIPNAPTKNAEDRGSVFQNRSNPGSSSIRPIARTFSAQVHAYRDRYPGESVLDLNVDPKRLRM